MGRGVLDCQEAGTGLRGTVALRPIGNRWPARRPSSTPCGEGGELWPILCRPYRLGGLFFISRFLGLRCASAQAITSRAFGPADAISALGYHISPLRGNFCWPFF